ncbi:MAG: hypothetical protein KO464_06915 [Candidatus Methanofastidiosum sp.]|nr:hypothetical protein [Methanofastidiosum sp.]
MGKENTKPYDDRNELKNVVIEDYCWIALNTIILPGVTLGKGSVVAAGAVVTKYVPPFAVVAGNPATVVKYRNKKRFDQIINTPWFASHKNNSTYNPFRIS